eukprot:CAMPEP_0178380820 /NCGR_PEP_ID=MMETSP0689_2-20121128/5662_1 /TAXON_ID=160604 /ORGANISM="Amphidinium massartii, Strain CS-259" /LENGTH=90 /DNA_ID=CAMNT_0020000979 /DNA_START=634 /DNA_END=907 /DNA_ORIENTATION=-
MKLGSWEFASQILDSLVDPLLVATMYQHSCTLLGKLLGCELPNAISGPCDQDILSGTGGNGNVAHMLPELLVSQTGVVSAAAKATTPKRR